MDKSKIESTYGIVAVGFMAALVFVSSNMSIPLMTIAGTPTRIHLGNVFCLLSGFLLGPVKGGLSAGIGSMFFDLMNPLYITSAPFTFVFKFMMAFVCGGISYNKRTFGRSTKINIIAGISGSITYVILYLSKGFIENTVFYRMEIETALIEMSQKGLASTINGFIAVIVAVPLAVVLKKSLNRVVLYRKVMPKQV